MYNTKKFIFKIKKIVRKLLYYISVTILMGFVLLGSWCMPPKWFEKVANGLKAKFNTEHVLEDNNDDKIDLM